MGDAARAAPLRLTRLSLRGFRNLLPLSLSPGPRFNVIHGDNGQGKSNLLEAIDYIARLRSFRGASTAELVMQGQPRADLQAELSGDSIGHHVEIALPRNGARQVRLDGKRPRSRANYFNHVQMVLFHPGDMQLAAGPPEQRRGFIDRILEQFDATYATTLHAYERALRSRNRLLRADTPKRSAVLAYDELLASAGAVIGQSRRRLLDEMAARVSETFRSISGEGLSLQLAYAPRVEPDVQLLRQALAASLDKDLARGFTAEGPHADDIALLLDGTPAKRFGSQGQHRAIVLALKVSELHELTRRVGRVPILLLDDVSSELDRRRNQRLFALLSELGGQVFLTTTQPELILIDHDRVDRQVRGGVVGDAGY